MRDRPRPAHLTAENAARFRDPTVVQRYHLRLPYDPEVFDVLIGLISDEPRTVLDVGTGTGDLARSLVDRVDRVDALDQSSSMIARGKVLPGGDHPRLHWIEGKAEEAPLGAPYALIVAGDSLHWMQWEIVLPRFADALAPHGSLAIVTRTYDSVPWIDGLMDLRRRYSHMQNYQPFDLIDELTERNLFVKEDEYRTAPRLHHQSVDDYIGFLHSQSSMSLDVISADAATAFDDGVRKLVASWEEEGLLPIHTVSEVVWGKPRVGDGEV